MASERVVVIRWLLTPLIALAAVTLAQLLAFPLAMTPLSAALGPAGFDSAMWAAKTVASVIMGLTFVASASWVAPNEKRGVALVAFATVILWSAKLTIGAFSGGFFPWLAAMAAAGAIGGACALWMAQFQLQRKVPALSVR